MTRPKDEFDRVLRLVADGHNDCQIGRQTGIPRRTVLDWRQGLFHSTKRYDNASPGNRCIESHDFGTLPPSQYSYLLGMYLGDGCLSEHRRGVFRLRISCDSQYPEIINECRDAMEAVMPNQHALLYKLPSRCVEISMYSKHWVCYFPQHGPGRKHERHVRLEPWQDELVNRETEMLVRGLIHSDGCRVIANDRGVRSVRYHFSNRSEDIKRIFCAALDRLEIPWTRPSDRDIAVYRKAATARLDEFIGPKK